MLKHNDINKGPALNPLVLFLQGMIVGTGAILPGISGGVLCIAFGLYEPMVKFLVDPFNSMRRNWRLFVPLIAGGGVGFLLLARAVEYMLTVAATGTIALFFGLICGTLPSLFRRSGEGGDCGWTGFVVSLALSFILMRILDASVGGSIEPNALWFVFCGVVWAFSMLLPGLSSSSVLLFMGLYKPMAEGIGHIDLAVVIPLMAGFAATLLLFARLVNYLMTNYHSMVSRILLGFVISSTLSILPETFGGAGETAIAVALIAVGFAVSYVMEACRKN